MIMIEKYIKSAIPCRYLNYNIWLYTCLPEYKSDVGNLLLNKDIIIDENSFKPDFSVSWYYNFPTDEHWLSLRSDDTKVDVCKIAKQISSNGGGHRNASGVTINASEIKLRELFIPIKKN